MAAADDTSALDAARAYLELGWAPIPIPLRAKAPIIPAWQTMRLSDADLERHFSRPTNIGVLLGEPSGGLVDVDLDCPEVVRLAHRFLRETTIFGRPGNPSSHRLYRTPLAVTTKYADPVSRSMLVEIRSTGTQTVFPGSVHVSGELIEFDPDAPSGDPLELPFTELKHSVGRLASAGLLVRHGWRDEDAVAATELCDAGLFEKLPATVQERLAEWLGMAPRVQTAPVRRARSSELDTRTRRASAYVARMPAAISGSGGHAATWGATCAVAIGFDLPDDVAMDILQREFNPRCDPPWTEKELRHKVESARRDCKSPVGYLADVTPPERPSAASAAPSSSSAPSSGDGRPKDKKDKPRIFITTDEQSVADQAIAALATHADIFQRAGALVHVVRDGGQLTDIIRDSTTPRIVSIPGPRLRELVSTTAQWVRYATRARPKQAEASEAGAGAEKDGPEWTAAHPPEWAVRAVGARGRWIGLRTLEAVIEAPVLRPDGSILDRPGFDAATGLLLVPNMEMPRIPERPTRDDAVRAAEMLLEVVVDFPFARPAHRAAWLASVLTPLARYAFRGPSPLNLIDANVRGAGKSLLADVIGLIVAGRSMARMSPSTDDAEESKRITAIALSGDPLVLIDNVAGTFGTASLDSALTGTTWGARILGGNEFARLPLFCTWYATGNNIILNGDTTRRCLHLRLESPDEKPEERAAFHHPDVRAWVRQRRSQLVGAALTMLRAYHVAGYPPCALKPWGSYEEWSRVVRGAIVWAGLDDPGTTRQELQVEGDREALALGDLVAGWDEISKFEGNCGITVNEALAKMEAAKSSYEALRSALGEFISSPPGLLPSAQRVGKLLTKFKGRVVNGRALVRGEKGTTGVRWAVRTLQETGSQ